MYKPLLTEYNEEDIKVFAEGNKDLEEVLLLCYKKGIPTHACCAGHIHEGGWEDDRPYLSFLISPKSKDFVCFCLENKILFNPVLATELSLVDIPYLKKQAGLLFRLNEDFEGDLENNRHRFFSAIKKVVQDFDNQIYHSTKFDALNAFNEIALYVLAVYRYGKIKDVYVETTKFFEVSGFSKITRSNHVRYHPKNDSACLEEIAKCFNNHRKFLAPTCKIQKKKKKLETDLWHVRRKLLITKKQIKDKLFGMEK